MNNKRQGKLNNRDTGKFRASDFGIPESREFSMPDAIHVRATEAYFRYAPEDKKAMPAYRIFLKAKKFGVNIESPNRTEWPQKYKKTVKFTRPPYTPPRKQNKSLTLSLS